MQIIPAILERSVKDIENQLYNLFPYFNTVQIDIVDGVFASSKTPSVADLLTLQSNPPFSQITFDFHLMTQQYKKELENIRAFGKKFKTRSVFIHINTSPDYALLIKTFPEFTFGAVFNTEDNIYEAMKKYDLNTLPIIQLMSVHIGTQGSPFIEISLKKIEQLKKEGFSGQIFLDGGVNKQTIPIIFSKKFRPDALCVGSYITKTGELKKRAAFLKEQTIRADLDV